jgi:DNA-binding GntR family transcriptional regulator
LAGEGLVDLDPHRGVVVHQPTVDELQEVYRIRLVIEPLAIAATVENITSDRLQKASHILSEMDSESDVAEWAIMNALFHADLAKATGLPILASLLEKLRNLSTLYVASAMSRHPDIVAKAQAEHRALLEACKRRDIEAAKQIEIDHLKHTLVISEAELDGFANGDGFEP